MDIAAPEGPRHKDVHPVRTCDVKAQWRHIRLRASKVGGRKTPVRVVAPAPIEHEQQGDRDP